MDKIFDKMELVYKVYEERSFSKAAQKLFISQPSLSVMIKQIEDEAGVPLFDRSCKPIRMTEAGMEYIHAAEEIKHTEQNYSNYLSAVNNLETGSLSIGSNQLFSSVVLPKYVSEFVQRYPKIKLSLVDANSAELEEKLISGQLDLIIDNKLLDPMHFEKTDFCTESLLLAVPSTFSLDRECRRYKLTLQDIIDGRHLGEGVPAVPLHYFENIPFILMTRDNDTRIRTDGIFKEHGFIPSVMLEIDRLVTLYNFILQGTAAAVVSDTLIKNMDHSSDLIDFYKLGSKNASRGVYIHCKLNKYHSPAMLAFEKLLCKNC